MDVHSGLTLLGSRDVNRTAHVDDSNFGPFLRAPDINTFDFTLLFEETILSIGPSAFLLILIPPRVLHLWKLPRKLFGGHLLTTKIVSFLVYLWQSTAN
jgi:ATP-binding cassette subfamily C (CFTR/MRP) protein 1